MQVGLSSAEARELLARDGANQMPEPARQGLLRQFVRQLTHLLALLLWVASGFALLAGMPELAAAIVVIVLLNAAFAFWQEYRADRSTLRLRRLLPTRTWVVRDGHPSDVDATELVCGDLVMLAPGDRVPADLRVESSDGLRTDESLVTGESRPVPHSPGQPLLAGSFVTQGEGTATVVATGARTSLAGIATLSDSADRPPSPLTRQLARVVRVVALLAVATGILLGVCGLLLGLSGTESFLFAVGVTVALVPEGLLPTVTLSLARGARLMADRHALVRRLDAVETLGATTFICTDKTGTLTQNRMAVVDVVTRQGLVTVAGRGYDPEGTLRGPDPAVSLVARLAAHASACVSGRVAVRDGDWVPEGDPMEAALHCLALRAGVRPEQGPQRRRPYSPDRMVSSAITDDSVSVLGAPEQVFARCLAVPEELRDELSRLTSSGRRVLAVATRPWSAGNTDEELEHDLELLGLLGVEDPPREGIEEALRACRAADIRVAMLTGDHPSTAAAIAREVGLLGPAGIVVVGSDLPDDEHALGALLDQPDGVVVARVTPADKFRIARALRGRGHVVAMTGDGVNDAPALREADVGVAMGAQRQRRGPRGGRPGPAGRPLRHHRHRDRAGPGHVPQRPPVPHLPPDRQRRRARPVRRLGAHRVELPARHRRAAGPRPGHRHRHAARAGPRRGAAQPAQHAGPPRAQPAGPLPAGSCPRCAGPHRGGGLDDGVRCSCWRRVGGTGARCRPRACSPWPRARRSPPSRCARWPTRSRAGAVCVRSGGWTRAATPWCSRRWPGSSACCCSSSVCPV